MPKARLAMQDKSKKVHDLVFLGSSKSKARWRNRMLKTLDILFVNKTPKSSPFPAMFFKRKPCLQRWRLESHYFCEVRYGGCSPKTEGNARGGGELVT